MKSSSNYISYQGYATLFGVEHDPSRRGVDALDMLRRAKLSLTIPGAPGKVLVLDETCENRLDVLESSFYDLVRRAPHIWFKVWSSRGSDLLCNWQWTDGWWCEYYAIGYLQQDSEPLVKRLVDRFVTETRSSRECLLIVDWQDRAEAMDWREVWEEETNYAGDPLEVMGIPSRLLSHFNGPMGKSSDIQLPGHSLWIDSDDSLE
jgi:hypothetical protein